jgi:type II secretory pathway component PulF
MNYDEFAFFNQQLAAMLRDGIPLEGALKELCVGMKSDPLRAEIEQLEKDLAGGTPLKEALARRRLPGLYQQMVEIGARSNDLPGVLTLLADHYQRAGALWNRLKGLMVYPFIVIIVALALTTVLSFVFSHFLAHNFDQFGFVDSAGRGMPGGIPMSSAVAAMWAPPVVLALIALVATALVANPKWRERLRWHLPAFRDASLAQLASAMSLMLKNGTTLPEALALAEGLEFNSPAGPALAEWRRLIESGKGRPEQWPNGLKPFPPMFLWLVRKGGEDVAAGFQKAAEIFQSRAGYRIELALYGALPVSVLLLGQMVFWQVAPLFQALIRIMNMLGSGLGGD